MDGTPAGKGVRLHVLAIYTEKDRNREAGMPETSSGANEARDEPGAARKFSAGRRSLLRGAAGATPVMLTLVSRPVIGQTCTSASAFGSANASRPAGTLSCSGRTPGYWKQSQHFSSWNGYVPTGSSATLFNDVFGTTGGYNGKTLLYVLNQGGGGKTALARHIVAALLNAAAGLTPVLDVAGVKAIWTSYVTYGYYKPTAGVQWNADQIVTWLKTTMPL